MTATEPELTQLDVDDGYLKIGDTAFAITPLGDVIETRVVDFTVDDEIAFCPDYYAVCDCQGEPIADEDLFCTEAHAVEVNIRRLSRRLADLRKAESQVMGRLMDMRDRACEIKRGS